MRPNSNAKGEFVEFNNDNPRKYGRFKIHADTIAKHHKELTWIFADAGLLVVRASNDMCGDYIFYSALGKPFRRVLLGETIPTYTLTFLSKGDGTAEYKFIENNTNNPELETER